MSWEEDDELERFKKEIDLRVYAASQGYVLDHEASGPHSFVMRHPNGDKVVIHARPSKGTTSISPCVIVPIMARS